MNVRSYMIALAALTVVACNDIDIQNIKPKAGELLASVEDNGRKTKAGFDVEGDFYWSENDSLGVTINGNETYYSPLKLKTGEGTGFGRFIGDAVENLGHYAVFPYSSKHKQDGSKLTFNYPSTYTYDKVDESFFASLDKQGSLNSFSPAMWGLIDNQSVTMKHLGGIFCVKVESMPASEGVFTLTVDDKRINGDYTVDLSKSEPYISAVSATSAAERIVTINYSGAQAGKSGVFYVPVPVGEYSNVTIKIGDRQFVAGDVTINRRSLKQVTLSGLMIPGGYTGKYYLPKTSGIVNITVLGNITDPDFEITYADGATDIEKPSSILLDAGGKTISALKVNTPDSHFEIANGTAVNVISITSESTLVIQKDFTIDTLSVKRGSVTVKGEVTSKLDIDSSVEGTIHICDDGKVPSTITNNSADCFIEQSVNNKETFNIIGKNTEPKAAENDATVAFRKRIAEGGNITLEEDILLMDSVEVRNEVVLDLNGHKIQDLGDNFEEYVLIVCIGKLTIEDNSTAGTGIIFGGDEITVPVVVISDSDVVATLTVNSGTIKGGSFCAIGNENDVVININGGSVIGGEIGILHYEGTLNVKSGQISGQIGIVSMAAKTVINGGHILAEAVDPSIYAPVHDAFVLVEESSLNLVEINGGTFISKAGSAVSVFESTAVTGFIHGGTFSDESAVQYAAANANITVQLQADRTAGTGVFVKENQIQNIVFDLNGHTFSAKGPAVGSTGTVSQAFHLEKGNTVTIKNGTLNVASDADDQMKMLIQNYCNLTLEDVTVDGTNLKTSDSQYVFSNNCGKIEMKGTTSITAPEGFVAFDVCKYGSYTDPKVTWNSTGSVAGIIELSGGEFVVTKDLKLTKPIKAVAQATFAVNANITPASGWSGGDGLVIVRRGGDLTVNGTGKISYNNNTNIYEAVKMTESGEAASGTVAKLTLNGPTLEGYYYGITGNGGRQNTDITINSGTVKGFATNDNAGIYHPQSGNLTINGGTIEGATGIYVKSGTVVTAVNGGTVKGTGAKAAYQTKGDGFVSTGDALLFDNCDYPGGEPHATINGGTFISTNANAVASYAKDGKTPITDFIHGGTYSDESAVQYAAANANITVQLQADRTAGTGVFVKENQNQNIMFDLNGHTFSAKGPAVGSTGTVSQAFHLEKGNTVTIKNGTLNVASDADAQMKMLIQNYCDLTLENVAVIGTNLKTSNSQYVFSNNCGNINIKGSTSITAPAGFFAFDVCKYGTYSIPTVTVNTTGTITGQVEVTGGNLVVTAGTFTNSSIALMTRSGNVTVNGGSFTSTGHAAVAVKGGTATFNNGTFTGLEGAVITGDGTGATIDIKAGTYTATDNAVIAGYGGVREGSANNIKISGGTFNGSITSSGYKACGIYSPWKDVITVTGGTFNIDNGCGILVRGGQVSVSGATFNFTNTDGNLGKVGDSQVVIPAGKQIVKDVVSTYPDYNNIQITAPGYTIYDVQAQ